MSTETVDVLRRARALIADPERWTTGDLARDRDGRSVPLGDPAVWSRCALGALSTAMLDPERIDRGDWLTEDDYWNTDPGRLLDDIAEDAGWGGVCELNDRDGHAAVLAMYDRAIALAEAEA